MVSTFEEVTKKTGTKYFSSDFLYQIKRPLIDLGYWADVMANYTEQMQANYFQPTIAMMEKAKKNPAKYEKSWGA